MTDTALSVIEPTSAEMLDAFPIPAERPMMWKALEGVDRNAQWPEVTSDDNLVCGKCVRVVAAGMTLLDLWRTSGAPKGKRLIWRCTCGAHLLVPTSKDARWLPLREWAAKLRPLPRR